MKADTQYYYIFQNIGNPEDTESGLAGWHTMLLAQAKWLARVSMNSEIRVTYSRKEGIKGSKDQGFEDVLGKMFAEVMADNPDAVNSTSHLNQD